MGNDIVRGGGDFLFGGRGGDGNDTLVTGNGENTVDGGKGKDKIMLDAGTNTKDAGKGVEPKFKVPDRPSKLDPFADRLSAWLKSEASKACKQKGTMKQLHADLLNLGYDGSYCRVAARIVMSMSPSRRWPATISSKPSSAIRRPAGRRDRSRRTCRMHGIASSSQYRDCAAAITALTFQTDHPTRAGQNYGIQSATGSM